MDLNDDEKVGYGKPPKATQFRKGQSGNPKGRPKGGPNLPTALEKAMRETVVIKGQRKTINKLEAGLKQLVNKAVLGDDRAIYQLLPYLPSVFAEELSGEATDPRSAAMADKDKAAAAVQKLLQNIVDIQKERLMNAKRPVANSADRTPTSS